MRFVQVTSVRKENHRIFGRQTVTEKVIYTLSPKAFRLYHHNELPKGFELESWETPDDNWIKLHGNFENLNTFLRCGQLPGPRGGLAIASNGYALIGAFGESIFSVHTQNDIDITSGWKT